MKFKMMPLGRVNAQVYAIKFAFAEMCLSAGFHGTRRTRFDFDMLSVYNRSLGLQKVGEAVDI